MNYAMIRKEREKAGISQSDFAKAINVSKQTLYKYEQGIITNIPSDKIEEIANVLGLSPSYLMGWEEDIENSENVVKIPVLGEVIAGIPMFAVENILDYEEIPSEMAKSGEYFALKIKGDSMSPRILEGDVVIVRKQDDAESGDIVIVLVNGDSATCKKLAKGSGSISLISFNPSYNLMSFSKKEISEKPVKIIGKVVELRGKF